MFSPGRPGCTDCAGDIEEHTDISALVSGEDILTEDDKEETETEDTAEEPVSPAEPASAVPGPGVCIDEESDMVGVASTETEEAEDMDWYEAASDGEGD